MKRIVWNGITYPSIAAAARACGISNTAMRSRLARGYTSDDDMNEGRA